MTSMHVLAGSLALLAGFTAMFAVKGGWLHRKSGLLFVAAILVMGASGALMAAMQPARLSVVAGLLAIYLVTTSLLTIRRSRPGARHWLPALCGLGLGVAGLSFYFGALGLQHPKHALDGFPAPAYLVFGSIALLGALLDLRVLQAGGIQGRHRLARHLWRMEMAMLLTAASFFLGQAKLFPDAVRQQPALLAAPVLLVLLHGGWWLWTALRDRPAAGRRAGASPR